MCDRWRFRLVALLCGALLVPAAGASGQTAAAAAARFRSVADTLERVQARMAAASPTMDTLVAGPLRVIVPPALSPRIRPALPAAVAEVRVRYGGTALAASGAIQVEEVRDSGAPAPHLEASLVRNADRWNAGRFYARGSIPLDSISAMLVGAAGDGMWPATGAVFRDWIEGSALGWGSRRADWEQAYVDLVTDPMHTMQGCFRGDPVSCRRAFGLGAPQDTLLDWLDAADRRTLIARFGREGWFFGGRNGQVAGCLEGHHPEMCDGLIASMPREYLRPPMTLPGRRSLTWLALSRGGEGAFERLTAHPEATLADRLSAAARLPVDSLLALWRSEVLAARPAVVTLSARSGWVALGWIALLGMLALRSTRWR
jgi:hypothetical protein